MEKSLEQQIAELTQQVSDLTATNATLTGQLTESRTESRAAKHKAAFRTAALEQGVRPKAVEALYRELGYDPGEVDEPDDAAIAELIAGGKEEFDYYFEPPEPAPIAEVKAAETGKIDPKPAPRAALGAGRGKPAPATDKFRVTRENTQDPAWLLANQKEYNDAGKTGKLEIVG